MEVEKPEGTRHLNPVSAIRVVGFLILAISILFFSIGIGMRITGNLIVSRYETQSGRFLRSLSSKDQTYYRHSRKFNAFGAVCLVAGIVTGGLGTAIVAKPQVVADVLKNSPRLGGKLFLNDL